MFKRIASYLLVVCLLCTFVLTGCANEGAEIDDGNKQVSSGVLGSEITDSDATLNDGFVLDSKGPSSKRVEELAANGQLTMSDIKNYYDYKLYAMQDNPDIEVLRNNIVSAFPLEALYDVGKITFYDAFYFLEGGIRTEDIQYGGKAYFADYFCFDSGFNAMVFALKDSAINTAEKGHKALALDGLREYYKDEQYTEDIYRSYDKNLLANGNLFKLDAEYRGAPVVMCVGDSFVFHYNTAGDLEAVGIYYDGTYVHIRNLKPAAVEKMDGFMAYLLNPNTISLAASAMDTAVKAVEVVTK